MRLLIITQKVEADAPILGFFVRWLRQFADQFEEVLVLSQFTGLHDLPKNVRVLSLGKERGYSRIRQIFLCWKYCRTLRHEYDYVLVHMTPIWIVLNAPLWILQRKRMYLWYESLGRQWSFWVALLFVRKIFSASSLHLPLLKHKNVVTNHGIDTSFWKEEGNTRDPHLIAAMGRVSPVKRIELIIECFATLPSHYRLLIAGGPFIDTDLYYYKKIDKLICKLNLHERVSMHFLDSAHAKDLMSKATLFLHAAAGTLDKSVLQAMACGTPIVSCCPATKGILPAECQATPETFSEITNNLLKNKKNQDLIKKSQEIVRQQHSLSMLVCRLKAEMIEEKQVFSFRSALIASCILLASCTMNTDGDLATLRFESRQGMQAIQ